jgi:TetR/AcrR family transcriptional regulator, transcriptional repressor for nem operon
MVKLTSRQKILKEGLRVVHEQGFAGAGVRDIVKAAGVSPGSFTDQFASKEVFGLEILNLYFEGSRENMRQTLRNESLTPLKRIRAFIENVIAFIEEHGFENGCVIVNFSGEASGHSELIRNRLVEIYRELQVSLADCLKAAVKAGELPPKTASDELAVSILDSLHGAILHVKIDQSRSALDRFKRFLFSTILR